MTKSIPPDHPLRRLFAGLVEHAFYTEIGMCDPWLTKYLSDLLADFVHVDRIYALRDAGGRRIEEVAEMVTEAAFGSGVGPALRRRLIHKHVGDFTLFWTGVYPEGLKRIRSAHRKDNLIDYLQGKRSYAIASQLTAPDDRPPAKLLRRLSENFEFCVYGLGLVRKGWERLSPATYRATRRFWS